MLVAQNLFQLAYVILLDRREHFVILLIAVLLFFIEFCKTIKFNGIS